MPSENQATEGQLGTNTIAGAHVSPFRSMPFRFLFCLFCIYLFVGVFMRQMELEAIFGITPGAGFLMGIFIGFWAPLVAWTGHHLLGLHQSLAFMPGGNSDGLFSHVELFLIVLLAILAALIWSLAARKATPSARLSFWLRIALRYALALKMWGYGLVKIYGVQFPAPSLFQLRMHYGDLAPFDVLWNFMGSSKLYTDFSAIVEISAAVLLLFRRTTTLGAMIAAAALVNVFMLDVSYGVPEKLDVLCFLAMASVIFWPDAPKLLSVLLLDRPAPPSSNLDWATTPPMTLLRQGIKLLVIAYAAATAIHLDSMLRSLGRDRSPLYGIYQVKKFTMDGQAGSAPMTDTNRWTEAIFLSPSQSWIRTMDDTLHLQSTAFGPSATNLTFIDNDSNETNRFAFFRTGPENLTLNGSWNGKSIAVTMQHLDEAKLNLLNTPFQWIDGYP